MKKRIPYSISDYKKISNGTFYYVDKTRYIEKLENWEIPLFLRPKRFGKSLWCSTLSYYYDINYKNEFEQLFGHTYIGQHPTESHNTYAVMSFSFASVDTSGSVEAIRRSFNDCCYKSFADFVFRYSELKLKKEDLPEDATAALNRIFIHAREAALSPIYIIIDEYDNFTNTLLISHGMDDYHAVTTGDSFLRVFYKAIKEAVGEGIVGKVFITGVLPTTMDDFTSGFNIATNVSREKTLLGMAGFTQSEVNQLVEQIFQEQELSQALHQVVLETLKANYDGYVFLNSYPEGLYNSTICNFYLQSLCINQELPEVTFDVNLAIDSGWLNLMAKVNDKTADIMLSILQDGNVPLSRSLLDKYFNAMLLRDHDGILLLFYYLGILTWNNASTLRVPNQNQLVLLGQYCHELQGWNCPDSAMNNALTAFSDSRDVTALFAVFWNQYIGLIPATAFTHLCENFYRTSFFMLCKPNMPKGMDADIEQNTHSGRYDMRFWGYGLPWWDSHTVLLEFKYRRSEQALPPAPLSADIEQLHAYAADQQLLHPEKQHLQYLVYIRGHEEWAVFPVER